MKKKVSILLLALILIVGLTVWLTTRPVASPGPSTTRAPQPTTTETALGFDKAKFSVNDPNSIWVVVNKKRPLPDNFAPIDLKNSVRAEANAELQSLITAAKTFGFNYKIISGYRSFANQQSTYSSYVQKDGAAKADTYSARAGHSEHQTGWAVDLGTGQCDLQECFGNIPAGKWLEDHAHEYGFVIRYPKGKDQITGYQYEPWHLRFVGIELARELKIANQTMEEFFDLPAAPSY